MKQRDHLQQANQEAKQKPKGYSQQPKRWHQHQGHHEPQHQLADEKVLKAEHQGFADARPPGLGKEAEQPLPKLAPIEQHVEGQHQDQHQVDHLVKGA
jgi:hypothetical protein